MVIVVIDAVEGITEQDAKIAGIAHERGKRCDHCSKTSGMLSRKMTKTIYKYTNKVREVLAYMPYAEILFYLRTDRTASSETVRDDRYGTGKPDTAYPDRCAQRDHDRSDRDAAATVRQRKNV